MKTVKLNIIKSPKFETYACIGDYIEWIKNGYTIRAVLYDDSATKPLDFDCYSAIKIKQWMNDEWSFCGVVLEVSYNGVLLHDHCASLWGIELNYNKTSNRHLSEVAFELESEALEYAQIARNAMLDKLQ